MPRRKRKGTGTLSKPPPRRKGKALKKQRAKRQARRQAEGLGKYAADFVPKGEGDRVRKLTGLRKDQSKTINRRTGQDNRLSEFAGDTMLPQVFDSYAQPFDWGALPQAPIQEDFAQWRQGQIDSNYNNYVDRMSPQWDQEKDEFEQMMYERGHGPGSDVYEREKNRLLSRHDDARQNALVTAENTAAQSAGQFYDIGQQDRSRALGEGLQQRGQALGEYNALNAAQSPMMMQNLGFSQQLGLQNDAQRFQARQNALNRQGLGGGGAGGPPTTPWGNYGFGGPAELDAYREQQRRDQQLWNYQNNPQYQQGDGGSGVSPWAQLGGQALGTGLGIWASTF